MSRNIDATGGLIFSQKVLLALTEALGDRERAYRIVQGHAMEAWDGGGSFRARLLEDAEILAALASEGVDRLFDPSSYLSNLGPIFERVLASEWGRRA
jgi:adenylosuccinate lyase